MEIQMGGGGGSLNLEILKGRGGDAQVVLEIQVEGRGSKNMPSIRGCVDFFWNNPFNIFLFHLREQLNVSYWVTEALGTLNFIGLLYIISSHEAIT